MELLSFIKPYRKGFIIGSLAKFAEAFLELYLPILMAQILDTYIGTGSISSILYTGLKMIGFAILGFICAGICQYFAAITSWNTGTSIRNAMIEKISSLSYKELDNLGTSSLINRITTDVNYYQQAVAMTIRLVTRAPFICIGAVIMSFSINSQLALIFVILIPLLGLVLYLFMHKTSPLYAKAQEKLDRFTLIIRENLSGVRVIRAFAKGKKEEERACEAANDVADSYTYVGSIFALMQPINSIILNISTVAVLYFGASFVFKGKVTQGDILSLTIYSTKILYALIVIANLIVLFTKARVSSKRISEILAIEPEIIDDNKQTPVVKQNAPVVQVKNLTFGYSEENPVLSNINLTLDKGETMGIVGITASGKTTLVELIQNFYKPNLGEVLYKGVPVSQFPDAYLRENIGFVPQKNVLFSGTIKDNMLMANKFASNTEIDYALKTAQCWDFVSNLSGGIDTKVFEGGKNYSGGQRQRLTIARALVKNPDLLILDDSVSALDYKTDLVLRTALAENYPNMSKIIISQRISSVLSSDKIIVLDHGKVVGQGTHEELITSCTEYIELYNSQMSEEDKNETA